eukprot:CAMPEP_0178388430 /NCGR_PEP_ID=MMETSP0689_2-20121128/9589_1 /TAXON_ID=160604 /ORGANISM="Amphidinium massartii, Strain CS-259" /LENGTH=72 /DNA_ID=CAMNT_0020008833 /DNA_START=423 /DNA_END=638 /DNA_ORIENTATION=-
MAKVTAPKSKLPRMQCTKAQSQNTMATRPVVTACTTTALRHESASVPNTGVLATAPPRATPISVDTSSIPKA